MDGAFLVRPSGQADHDKKNGSSSVRGHRQFWAISFRYSTCRLQCHMFIIFFTLYFRAEGKIRHCRFQEEAGQFTIGSATFETMTELISYYEENPLYRRMKLKYAINDEILKQIGEVGSCIIYYISFIIMICCRTLRALFTQPSTAV